MRDLIQQLRTPRTEMLLRGVFYKAVIKAGLFSLPFSNAFPMMFGGF